MFTNTHSLSVHKVGATHSVLLLRNGSTEKVWNELRVAQLVFWGGAGRRGPTPCAPIVAPFSNLSVSSAAQAMSLTHCTGVISAQLTKGTELMASLLWKGAVVHSPRICVPQTRPPPLPVHV